MHRSILFVSDFCRLTRYRVFKLSSIVALAAVTIVLGGTHRVDADIIITTPLGLMPGDTFRIAFLTDSVTTALSTDIAVYNHFVNAEAGTQAGGSVTYNGTLLKFSAIGSTPGIDAITNIGQTGASVYLANGTEVDESDTAAVGGLWSGGLIHNISKDLNNVVPPSVDGLIWTGTLPNGLAYTDAPLGTPDPAVGTPMFINPGYWVTFGLTGEQSLHQMYGISQALTVVPEPASIVLCLSAAGCGAVGAYVRRRRAARRVH